ncbi:MAG: class I SAM-dependent methyltransferase [Methanotrichaceae archaeon]|nr:class I SAM-dependent methyltransferase [Methanotrichaceae archaeon]
MIEIKCPFCDIFSNNIVITETGYTGKKCKKCNTIFISPRPTKLEMIQLYEEDNACISAEAHILPNLGSWLHAKHNLSLIKKHIPFGSILEIGAGGGWFLDEARSCGFEVYGIEINNKQANFINTELDIACESAPLNDSSFGTKKFDIIYHCDVISHFYDPSDEFKKINSKLNDNGFVVFETGNGDMDDAYYKWFPSFQYPDHLFFFNEYSLNLLLHQTGFEIIKIYRYSILPQLFFNKIKQYVIGKMKCRSDCSIKTMKNDNYDPNSAKKGAGCKVIATRIIKDTYGLFIFVLRYKVGYIWLKNKRPYTMIIIAQKQ